MNPVEIDYGAPGDQQLSRIGHDAWTELERRRYGTEPVKAIADIDTFTDEEQAKAALVGPQGDIDAPVIVKFGLFGHAVAHVRAVGTVNDGDYRMKLTRPLSQLVAADSHYDQPDSDPGWRARAHQLDLLLDRIGEPRP